MKVLVAYFSHSGETRIEDSYVYLKEGQTKIAAKKIAELCKGDLFEIKTKKEYSSIWKECVQEAKKELKTKAFPELVEKKDIKPYDYIVLAYPMWWNTMPRPMNSFIDKQDFKGKKVLPFCTHNGGGIGNSINEIKNSCKGATITKELVLFGHKVKESSDEIQNWLNENLK